jgi:hypothetical protein
VLANRWVGVVLLVLGVIGIIVGTGLDDIVPLGGNDVWLHLGSGVILLGASLMSSRETAAAV